MQFLKKKIPFFYTIIFAFVGAGLGFFLFKKSASESTYASQPATQSGTTKNACNYNVSRLKGYEYIQPLLHQEPDCESAEYGSLKQEITDYINNRQQTGAITAASVYFKALNTEDWITVNDNESFYPGSLFKLPVLISLLKMAETDPNLMNKKVVFQAKDVTNVPQTYTTKTLTPGVSYSTKELLTYMIAYSDNNATQILNRSIKIPVLLKIFTDLGLTPPETENSNYLKYTIKAKDYSKFMETLYDGSYLTIAASEYATSLLAQCNFKDGLLKELPSNIKIAHKFGESGTAEMKELHETGIIYLGANAYLITVMTRGKDIQKLSETISDISKIAYNKMKSNS